MSLFWSLSRPNKYEMFVFIEIESKRTFNVQKLPQMRVYLDANKHFSLQKSTKLYRTPMKFFLGTKITFFEKWPQVTLLNEFNVEK